MDKNRIAYKVLTNPRTRRMLVKLLKNRRVRSLVRKRIEQQLGLHARRASRTRGK